MTPDNMLTLRDKLALFGVKEAGCYAFSVSSSRASGSAPRNPVARR
jgi:hypothetical protein